MRGLHAHFSRTERHSLVAHNHDIEEVTPSPDEKTPSPVSLDAKFTYSTIGRSQAGFGSTVSMAPGSGKYSDFMRTFSSLTALLLAVTILNPYSRR